MRTADDLFGGPQGSPRTDKLIAASIQWAGKIMEKIDGLRETGRVDMLSKKRVLWGGKAT
jgi:hypothetical protein